MFLTKTQTVECGYRYLVDPKKKTKTVIGPVFSSGYIVEHLTVILLYNFRERAGGPDI
jgi:hypothetical protein